MENVTFLENGTKVEAVNPKTYVFEPSMSRGSEEDHIRTVNIPAMVKLHLHKHVQPPTQAYIGRLFLGIRRICYNYQCLFERNTGVLQTVLYE